jgi:hypothetical protein
VGGALAGLKQPAGSCANLSDVPDSIASAALFRCNQALKSGADALPSIQTPSRLCAKRNETRVVEQSDANNIPFVQPNNPEPWTLNPQPWTLPPRVGKDNVIASDVKTSRSMLEGGPFAYLDVQDRRGPGSFRGEGGGPGSWTPPGGTGVRKEVEKKRTPLLGGRGRRRWGVATL